MPDREVEQFIHSLYEQARQDGEDPEEVARRVYQNARGVSRRELMGGAGALGLGGLLGGAGGLAATQNARADPSTSDSDGNVGTPSDPADVFAEGIGGPTGSPIDIGSNLDLRSAQSINNAASISTADAGSDPASNGEIQRNGTDVKIHTDGSVINLSGGEGSNIDADEWEGYDLQKDGTDGSGVINFKTQ